MAQDAAISADRDEGTGAAALPIFAAAP